MNSDGLRHYLSRVKPKAWLTGVVGSILLLLLTCILRQFFLFDHPQTLLNLQLWIQERVVWITVCFLAFWYYGLSRSFLSKHGFSKLVNRHLLRCLGVTLAFMGFEAYDEQQNGNTAVCLALGFMVLLLSEVHDLLEFQPEPVKEDVDVLSRGAFVDALFRSIHQEHEHLFKIALTGDWGTGKSFVLKMLRQKLENCKTRKYKVISVNPWHCGGREELQTQLAKSFEQALGIGGMLGASGKSFEGFFSILSHLPFVKNYANLGRNIYDLLGSNTRKDDLNTFHRVNEVFEELDVNFVVYVEDFEREDPGVVRKIVSILDELYGLRRTVFICTIDIDAFRHAYTDRGQQAADSYLEKVFDIVCNLPRLQQDDIKQLLPKSQFKNTLLCQVWDELSHQMPLRPRKIKRFMQYSIFLEEKCRLRREELKFDVYFFYNIRLLEFLYPNSDLFVKKYYGCYEMSNNDVQIWTRFISNFHVRYQERNRVKRLLDVVLPKRELGEVYPIEWYLRDYMRFHQSDIDLKDEF